MKHPVRWILLVVLFVLVGGAQKVSAVTRSTSASNDPDINIRLRGWVDSNYPRVIIDHTGFEDPKAPQLSTLIGETVNYNPIFTYLGQVKSRNGTGLDSSNTTLPGIMSIQAAGGATIYSPRQGYDIGGGYSYVILYATNSDIVIHNTPEDSVARGYTIHLMNINVDQKLLDLYNQNEANGRQQLVAIGCHIKLGTVNGSDVQTIIRDTGSFMPQYRDWWLRQIPDCKELPPGLITAPKRPPSGPFLDNSTGKAPLTKIEPGQKDVTGQSTVADSAPFIEKSGTVTFPNFSKEDQKFTEMFDPNLGGGELVPASLQEKVQYPDEQSDYTGYNEIYAAGCARVDIVNGESSGNVISDQATQSKPLPDPYPRTQASFNILGSLRAKESSGLQYRVKQPDIVATGSGNYVLTQNYKGQLFNCGEDQNKKQVTAVNIEAEGFIQKVLASVSQAVTDIIRFFTGCDADGKNCTGAFAKVSRVSTATVFLPGSQEMQDKAVGDQKGSLLTFFPSSITDQLSGVNGCTGGSTEKCASEDLPHYQMHAVKDTFTKTSSCMLLPASVQQERGTTDKDCKLAEAAPTPSLAPTPPPDGAPRLVQTPTNPIDINDTQCRYNVNNFRSTSTAGGKTLESVASFFCRYYPRYCTYGERNFKNLANTIQDYAVSHGYNPAFFLSMWIEESGASGNPALSQSWALGCRGDLRQVAPFYAASITLNGSDVPDEGKVRDHINEQLKCITSTFDAAKRYIVANLNPNKINIYTYTLTEWATGSYSAAFPTGPAGRISLWYDQLAGSCGILKP